jgi:predicted metal-dependent enzyme (double-stranded beta helix superfamily)
LVDIAEGIAAAEDLWRPHARHDATERRPTRLLAADRWEAWVIGWTVGQHVELHDHGDAAGALAVVEGSLLDLRWQSGTLDRTRLRAGTSVHLPVGIVHDVVATEPVRTTSIHVYSPPLQTMTFYGDSGRPTRTVAVEDDAPVNDLRAGARALHPGARRG